MEGKMQVFEICPNIDFFHFICQRLTKKFHTWSMFTLERQTSYLSKLGVTTFTTVSQTQGLVWQQKANTAIDKSTSNVGYAHIIYPTNSSS